MSPTTPFSELHVFLGSPSGGKQKKAEHTGFYEVYDDKDNKTARKFYKKSEDYPVDDMMEYMAAGILRKLVGEEHIPKINLVRTTDTGTVYLETDVLPGFTEIYKHGRSPTAEVHRSSIKKEILKRIQGKLSKREKKNRGSQNDTQTNLSNNFAKILAGCLLIGEYDVQPENLAFYNNNGKREIAKIDHGWAFKNILKPKHKVINLFSPYSRFSKSEKRMRPVNHFLIYKDILKDYKIMPKALTDIAGKLDEVISGKIIENSLNEILKNYPVDGLGYVTILEQNKIKCLSEIGEKMGVELSTLNQDFTKKDSENLKTELVNLIQSQLVIRKFSLLLTAEFIKIKNQKIEEIPDKIIEILGKYREHLVTQQNQEPILLSINEVLPKKLIKKLEKDLGLKNNDLAFEINKKLNKKLNNPFIKIKTENQEKSRLQKISSKIKSQAKSNKHAITNRFSALKNASKSTTKTIKSKITTPKKPKEK